MLSLSKPFFTKLLTVASTSTTATSSAFSIPIADSYTFFLNVTTATAGTMNASFLTSVDGGTTFVLIPWCFAQVATTTGCFILNARSGIGSSFDPVSLPTGTGAAATPGTAQNLQCLIDPANMQLKYTIATGPYAFTLYAGCWTRASGTASE
jgi:hypothetical protein